MASKRRDKSAQSYPVDPTDLHRRLCVVLAQRREQEAMEQRAKEAAQRSLYRTSSTAYYPIEYNDISGYTASAQRFLARRPQSVHIDHGLAFEGECHNSAPTAAPQIPTAAVVDNLAEEGLVRRLSKKAREFHKRRSSGGDALTLATAIDTTHVGLGTSLEHHQSQSREISPTDERQTQRSNGGSSDMARSADQRASTCGPLWRADTMASLPLNKPSTSDGVLHVNPVPYEVGWAQNHDMAPPKSAPLKKSGSGWHKLSWGRSSRKAEKKASNGQKSPLTSLFARFRR